MCDEEEVIATHKCDATESSGCEIYQLNTGGWWLSLSIEATSVDLENNHYLEYEGQTTSLIILPVAFCPYCGKQLEAASNTLPSYVHNDFSRW
ncbi:hypothetical protein [Vibrio sp. F74]|uniref:hypothetical protein n=1 Tax=Vibrio sp. F74 TaxID=700020 RepID=UPI0035F59B04